jgi:glycosyltransferase involved in cell wall biosynthesis
MKFSIIVPTYNEEKDIADTLEALIALDYSDKEIIVVDDSTDSTPDIVSRYADKGVKLIHPEKREGRCGARNLGVLSASGEVAVILNADVRPPKDFLNKILPYYQQGYDYVLVNSEVANKEYLFARYVGAVGDADQSGDPSWMEWTEGFSCRREIAIKAGLFPTGFAVPICAGEDGFFGTNLKKIGARKKIDFTITVGHIAPATLIEYWHVRKGRGKGSPQIRRFLQGWSTGKIAIWAALRIVKNLILISSVLPVLWTAWRATRYSGYGTKDLFPFIYAWLIEQAAFHVGEWESIFEIAHAEKNSKCADVKRKLKQ